MNCRLPQKILDTMDIKKIKNILDMNLLAEVYEANGRYEEAKDLYLNIYKKAHSRKSLFKLINILIKLNDSREAEYYFEQYERIAPDDFYNYIFRYYIEKIKGGTYESLIAILEELKKKEYIEKWAYELAKLYYKAGMEEECIRECSDIVLWFGEGTYVEKAKILRSYYAGEADKEWIMREFKRRSKSEEDRLATIHLMIMHILIYEEHTADSSIQDMVPHLTDHSRYSSMMDMAPRLTEQT